MKSICLVDNETLINENIKLKQTIKLIDSIYLINAKNTLKVVEENRRWNNHVVRMQYTVGIKNPDTIFTYREKLKHPINTRRTLKIK